jgi:hypothetical protein
MINPEKITMLAKEVDGKVYAGSGKCPGGDCPSVMMDAEGNMFIVGSLLDTSGVAALESTGLVKVYGEKGEAAVRVSAELVKQALSQIS